MNDTTSRFAPGADLALLPDEQKANLDEKGLIIPDPINSLNGLLDID